MSLRVLFHAINGVGLGHLVRASCLAIEARAREPQASLLILTNAGDTSLLDAAGLDYVQLPPRLAEPHADPTRSLRALPEAMHHRAFEAVAETFRPTLVVFDTHAPARLVEHAHRRGARTTLVLRELRPEALGAFLHSPQAALFDRIMMPHEPDEIDPSRLAPHLPIAFGGHVVRVVPKGAAEAPRAGSFVLAMAGGGGQPVDAARFCAAVADAHWLARARVPDLQTLLVTGPYGRAPERRFEGLEIVRKAPDLGSLIEQARLVVSQAGYNAVAELRMAAKPVVFVPGARRMEDQSERARRLARVGAAVLAKPEARAIADHLERLLTTPGLLDRMREAHERVPLRASNARAANLVTRPVTLPSASVEHVVLIAHDFPPRIGGMETMAARIAAELAASGRRVTVYTSDRLGPLDLPGLDRVRIRKLYAPVGPRGQIDAWGDLLLTLGAIQQDAPDAVHLTHGGLSPWIPAIRATLPCAVTTSVHGNDITKPWVAHDVDDTSYLDAVSEGLQSADLVMPVSGFSSRLALTRGVDERRVRVVLNGVDARDFASAAQVRLAGIAEGAPVVLTVSRLAARKGHATVIRALPALIEKHPSIAYAFTGTNDALLADLMDLARSLGVEQHVHALGVLPRAELGALYRRAQLFALLPDEHDDDVEGFGIALLEAAACGLPVLGSNTGGVPEALDEGRTGLLVPPGDAQAAAQAIDRLLSDAALAAQMGEAGKARAEQGFSWSASGDAFARAIDLALDLARAHPRRRDALGPMCALGVGDAAGLEADLDSPRVRLRAARSPGELARLGREALGRFMAQRAQARAHYQRVQARGGSVKLRAVGEGAHVLGRALDDCTQVGVVPEVETRLRRLVEPHFASHAAPRIGALHLIHVVPSQRSTSLLDKLRALPDAVLDKARSLRIYCDDEAKADGARAASAVPEVHALRTFFAQRGVRALPPPELMRYLSTTPAALPETAMFEPTNLCNLACPTCPTGTGKIPPLPNVTPQTFARVLGELGPQLRNLALWNYGEPTLHKQLPELIAIAKQHGVAVVKVSSNVHFLDGPKGRALLSSGLDVLILSVDGASEETYKVFRKDGSFARVANAVASLCAEKRALGLRKPSIELQFIAMRHNEHEIAAIRSLAATWGVDKLRIKTVGADDDENRASLVPTQRLLSRYRDDRKTPSVRHPLCTMPWEHTVVNVDGSVTPCCYLRPDMGEQFVMGNAFETPFIEIWRGPRYQAFRAAMLAGRASMPVCNTCRGGTHDLLASVEQVGAP